MIILLSSQEIFQKIFDQDCSMIRLIFHNQTDLNYSDLPVLVKSSMDTDLCLKLNAEIFFRKYQIICK